MAVRITTRLVSASLRGRRNFSTLLARMLAHGDKVALTDSSSAWSYAQLLFSASRLSQCAIRDELGSHVAQGPPGRAAGSAQPPQPRIAILCPRDHQYVTCMLAAWRAGAIAVPLPDASPATELAENYVSDSSPSLLFASRSLATKAEEVSRLTGVPIHWVEPTTPPAVDAHNVSHRTIRDGVGGASGTAGALMVYTSGTTGKPKGVLTSCSALAAQITALTSAWEWSPDDRILHVLPLHHVHGIMAKLLCALWSGAAVEMAPKFVPEQVWEALSRKGPASASGGSATSASAGASALSASKSSEQPISVFMAVPTVYSKLLEALDAAPPATKERWTRPLLSRSTPMRLMVSGSAALPVPVMARWRAATGHTLLERFGMSEFGLAISNPYREDPAAGRVRTPGAVGLPLPGFEARIVDVETGRKVAAGESGELHIRGAAMMSGYWGRPAATEESFAPNDDDDDATPGAGKGDGKSSTGAAAGSASPAATAAPDNSRRWFRTGDSARADQATGYITIEGRLSADIIKSGGFKLSALEIERHLLEHDAVGEVAVFGTPRESYGESVVALVVPRPGSAQAAQLAAAGTAPPAAAGSGGGSAPGSPTSSSLICYTGTAAAALSTELRAWAKGHMAAYKVPSVVRWVPEIPRNAMGKVNKKALRAQYASAAATAKA